MKYKVGLIEFTPGKYPGVLVIDDNGEGVFDANSVMTTQPVEEITPLPEFSSTEAVAFDGQGNPSGQYWMEAYNRTIEELKRARAELRDANASAAFHARNREKCESDRERDRRDLVAQRDQARSVIDYIYGPNSGAMDWRRVVEAGLTPPLPLEKHLQPMGLVQRHKYIEVRDELAKVQQHNQKLSDNNRLLVRERNSARETNSTYAYQLKIAQDEAEMLFNAVEASQRFVHFHHAKVCQMDEWLSKISNEAAIARQDLPGVVHPTPVPPYKRPAHMLPAIEPAPAWGYPLPPMAGSPPPPQAPAPRSIIGDNDGPYRK